VRRGDDAALGINVGEDVAERSARVALRSMPMARRRSSSVITSSATTTVGPRARLE
jgi:hypothetical protein